ncbi:MAG: agmatinase, partial [Gaiellales bacterium]|nr:agmatinase [Gaiellales bacterium]
DPAFAPGTGTPEIGGPSSGEALEFVRALTGIRLVAADVVEVAPSYDSPGQPTALLGATVAWEAIALHAVARSRAAVEPGPA